jgi:Domain of unknown function (DUF4136)
MVHLGLGRIADTLRWVDSKKTEPVGGAAVNYRATPLFTPCRPTGGARQLLLLATAILISACASTPDIRSDTNPTVDFASYKTFGFFSPLATDKAGYQTVFTVHLKDATRRAMESKGYVFSESNPDLLLNFYANVQDKQEIQSTPGTAGYGYRGYYGYRGGYYGGYNTATIETVNYKQGTLTIDLIDAKQKSLAWTATAEGRVSSEASKNPGPAIDTLVTSMMTPLTPAVR